MEQPKHINRLTPDGSQLNLEALYKIAPSCFTEALGDDGELHRVIDFNKLRLLLGDNAVDDAPEVYDFTWVGKRAALKEAAAPITKTLRPCPEESVNWDTTQNLYIEGDNLEVLKLLQNSYMGKVKMIYIDPPYNTGNDFVYHDDFTQTAEEYDENNRDDDGNRFRKNTDSNGRFHSDWCSMIYARLMVARSLLSSTGFIFVSIDEGEVENLKKMLNEVFGEANLVETFFWESIFRPSNMSKTIRKNGEYVLCYKKEDFDYELVEAYEDPQGDASLTQNNNSVRILSFPSGYVRIKLADGVYHKGIYDAIEVLDDIVVRGGTSINDFRIAGKFKWSQEYLNNEIQKGVTLTIKSNGLIPYYRKDYQKTALRPTKIISRDRVADVLRGGAEIRQLFDYQLFDYPKPTSLLCFLANIIGVKNGIVLDFFSGSATTAHAVMQLNSEDGGNRRFIMIQLPEETAEDSEAFKAGYKNICEIGKERIRRAGKKILEEQQKKQAEEGLFAGASTPSTSSGTEGSAAGHVDIGFRVFKCEDSNYKEVALAPKDYDQSQLEAFVDNIKDDRTDLDLLFDCMLRWGVELSLPLATTTVDGCTIHNVNDGDLVACFDGKVTESVIEAIAQCSPVRVIFRDSSFTEAAQKMNLFELFKQHCDWTDEEVRNNVRVI